MAITRSQIARQLLQFGGGADLGTASSQDFGFGDRGGRDDREIGARASRTRAAAEANQRALAALGDPDYQVDKDLKDREGIGATTLENLKSKRGLFALGLLNPVFGLTSLLPAMIAANRVRSQFGLPSTPPLSETDGSGDEGTVMKPFVAPLAAQAPRTEEQEPEPEVEGPFELSRRFRAEGGPIGGEFDFESARQMYGLGKLVKKVTKTVKKIAKSDIGKAALLYAGTGGLGNLAAGQSFFTGFTSPTTFLGKSKLANIFTRQGLGNIGSSLGLGSMISEKTAGDAVTRKFVPNLLGKALTSPTALITGASVLAGLLTPEQEEEAQELARGEGIDIEEARRSILNAGTAQDFRARRFRAEGGSMKEPVAKKTMPLLDLDGKEMDLRAEGGFVPIGRMEKADDVPARLSKNEFVFTADAVRNAGDGNVDKGAEVMYNMMKNLEAGGDVSEESQGLEGARKMFQTSQRLEEVL
jgi:hypothetical protein